MLGKSISKIWNLIEVIRGNLLLRFSDFLTEQELSCLILQNMLKKQNCKKACCAQTTKLSTRSFVDSYVNFTISCKPSFSQDISSLKNINGNWVKAIIFFYVTFRFKNQEFSVHPEISIIKKIMRHLLPFLIFFRKQEEKLSDHPDLGTNNNVPVFPQNQGNLLKGIDNCSGVKVR